MAEESEVPQPELIRPFLEPVLISKWQVWKHRGIGGKRTATCYPHHWDGTQTWSREGSYVDLGRYTQAESATSQPAGAWSQLWGVSTTMAPWTERFGSEPPSVSCRAVLTQGSLISRGTPQALLSPLQGEGHGRDGCRVSQRGLRPPCEVTKGFHQQSCEVTKGAAPTL